MSRLVLIDGNAIMHRAYHALPLLTNSQGEPTQAVYGFVAILLRVIEDLKPTHMAVAFDMPGPTFRNEMFAQYQAQRPAMEVELASQIDKIHRVVSAMHIPIYEMQGFEADDVIGTIAQKAQKEKIHDVVVVTGDRDLLQLVNHKVKLFMPVKGINEGKLYGKTEVEQRMGVNPAQIVDLKALMGDASDNYPGVAGIGPKTAVNLLHKYGNLANIYKNLKNIRNVSLRKKLENGKENAFLSQRLARVATDVPVKFKLNSARLGDLLTDEVIEVFGELGFKTLIKRLSQMSRKQGIKDIKAVGQNALAEGLGEPKEKQAEKQMELF